MEQAKMKGKLVDKHCNVCESQLTTWDERISKTLMYESPCCEKCIANEYGQSVDELRERFAHYFGMRPCVGL